MFKMFVKLINIKASNLWQSNGIYQAWTCPAMLKLRLLIKFKIADYFFEVRVAIVCKPA